MKPSTSEVSAMISKACRENMPTLQDGSGKYYELCYEDVDGSVVDKIREPYTHWGTEPFEQAVKYPSLATYSTPTRQVVLPKKYLHRAFKEIPEPPVRVREKPKPRPKIDWIERAKNDVSRDFRPIPASAWKSVGYTFKPIKEQAEETCASYSCSVADDIIEHDYYAVGIVNEAFGRTEHRYGLIRTPRHPQPSHRLNF